MPFKKIVCLANSRKLAHRCIAGKELQGQHIGGWIRPVSRQTPTGELSFNEMSFEDGKIPDVLDVITVPLLEHTPHDYQTENHLVDPDYYWLKQGTLQPSVLPSLCDTPDTLWINGYHSFSGYNDRIPLELAQTQVTSSLFLIKPETLFLKVADELNKRRVRAEFNFRQHWYRLMVTDPVAEDRFLREEDGVYKIGRRDVCLCISLGEPFNDFCYKLVAGVLPTV